MRRLALTGGLGAAVAAAVVGATAFAGGSDIDARARLTGFQEVPANSTTGRGSLTLDLRRSAIRYTLSYRDLEGAVTQAHIHLGQRNVVGGVSAFLCGGGDKPACPQEGRVSGRIDPADVIGPAAQGITQGEFGELLRALRNDRTYANVHSDLFPAGEIRGHIVLTD
jgi:hypothetical protein